MEEKKRTYIAIDLKSFYASVECVERHMDPLTTNLVVADESRTEKTICLAVSPSLKALGIGGRARLFEVIQKVRKVNEQRKRRIPAHKFTGKSTDAPELEADPSLAVDFVTAVPRMALYMQKSSEIYNIYLKYIAPEDIHVYSIDEVFMDVTSYMKVYGKSPSELARMMIHDVLAQTGITATAGIAPNLFLCKVAMDIVAKHIPADANGVRIAELDEESYRRTLWDHEPLTDFWRVGRGYARKLNQAGIFTMGDICRCSMGTDRDYYNEELLYRMFGVNAELLIDHAWGWEPCTIADIKAYKPESNSVGSAQVLQSPRDFASSRQLVREMADMLSLDLLEKRLVTDQIVLDIAYDNTNLTDPDRRSKYHGPVVTDRYGRKTPKPAHGSQNLSEATSSAAQIMEASLKLYDRITDSGLVIRRLGIAAEHVLTEEEYHRRQADSWQQMDLFTDYEARKQEEEQQKEKLDKERRAREAELLIRQRFGKNAILKGSSLTENSTVRDRNRQIGGHKA